MRLLSGMTSAAPDRTPAFIVRDGEASGTASRRRPGSPKLSRVRRMALRGSASCWVLT